MRLFLPALSLSLLAALPAEAATPPWHGVWQGTIGTLPVRACLQQRGGDYRNGSYYYLRQLKPIALQQEDNGTWTEHVGGGEEVSGAWTVAVSGGRLTGQWRGGKSSLPIALTRVAIPVSEEDPCASDAFVAPRVRPIRMTAKPASKAGLTYTEQTYLVGPSFEDVSITSFVFPPTRPGDAAINAALRLDPAKPESDADYLSCMKGQLGSLGTDGGFQFSYEPDLVTPEFLSVSVHSDGACGGASPYTANWHVTFDRASGKRIDLGRWFGAGAVIFPREVDPDGGEFPSTHQLTQAFRRVVLRHFPFDPQADADCRDAVSSQEYWRIAITRKGMAFEPDLARVVMACGDTAVVPFGELAPFLSPSGRDGIARLRR